MNHPLRTAARGLPALALVAALFAATAAAAAPSTTMPDTPLGKVGGELLRHVNGDAPEQLRAWAPTVLSPAVGKDDATDFIDGLVSAARDGGGVSLTDAHVQRGMLVLTVKSRRGGQPAVMLHGEPSAGAIAFLAATAGMSLLACWWTAMEPESA
jgi:hypothetical protein